MLVLLILHDNEGEKLKEYLESQAAHATVYLHTSKLIFESKVVELRRVGSLRVT